MTTSAARHPARTLLVAALVCATAIGCSKKVKETPPVGTGADSGASTSPVYDSGPTRPGAYGPADLDSDSCLRNRVVYFDLDQDALKPEFQSPMSCHAKYLRDRPSARLRLEGNADERGSREYNLGLGERRGNSARDALSVAGAGSNQLTVVSYGEERPTCMSSDDSCWQQNRRVEIVYTTK